jgi:hypothetical protein
MTAALRVRGGGRPVVRARSRWSVGVLAGGVFFAGFGSPRAAGFTIADVLIAAFVVLVIIETRAGREPISPVVVALVFPMLFLFAGTLIGAMHVGLAPWVVYDLIRDLGAAAALVAVLQVFDGAPHAAFRLPARAALAIGVVVAIHLLFIAEGTLRSKATFPNPNVAGHFMATAFIALIAVPLQRRSRVVGLTATGLGVVATGSFGAMLQVISGLCVLAYSRAKRLRPATRQLFAITAAGLLVLVAYVVVSGVQVLPARSDDTGYNAVHLERSSSGRLDLWGRGFDQILETPLGIGPGSVRAIEALRTGTASTETHNEPLAFMIERGAIGVLGLALLWATLWRTAVLHGAGRAMIACLVVASCFRETSHYRHLWILLGLVIAYERSSALPRERLTMVAV